MTHETFLRRLEAGKTNSATYTAGPNEGLIQAWRHAAAYVLTWEECPTGEQHNEHAYTRDDRTVFAAPEDVVAFLRGKGVDVMSFRPA